MAGVGDIFLPDCVVHCERGLSRFLCHDIDKSASDVELRKVVMLRQSAVRLKASAALGAVLQISVGKRNVGCEDGNDLDLRVYGISLTEDRFIINRRVGAVYGVVTVVDRILDEEYVGSAFVAMTVPIKTVSAEKAARRTDSRVNVGDVLP